MGREIHRCRLWTAFLDETGFIYPGGLSSQTNGPCRFRGGRAILNEA